MPQSTRPIIGRNMRMVLERTKRNPSAAIRPTMLSVPTTPTQVRSYLRGDEDRVFVLIEDNARIEADPGPKKHQLSSKIPSEPLKLLERDRRG